MKKILIELEDAVYSELLEKKQGAIWRDLLMRGANIIDEQTVITRKDLEIRLGNYNQTLTNFERRIMELLQHKGL